MNTDNIHPCVYWSKIREVKTLNKEKMFWRQRYTIINEEFLDTQEKLLNM